ncbi:two-component system sensor histidine kinase YesM [Paenibacillus harenae]|uniref:Two-component system sensor histidine kinase YesM n=2 Tax=Paenibacillus harenae TaxID=306543 RepID=A0ABT9UCD9_PAEHA|nr:two-component system sensor histidine kinase YesM [Paenibacillus harenae]
MLKIERLKFKFTLSLKFSIVLFVLLGIAVALNGHSYRVSIHVIESGIQDSYYQQLRFFLLQLDNQVDNLAANLLELEEDSTMKQYMNTTAPEDLFDIHMLRLKLYERIKLQSASSNWPMEISVFLKSRKEVISTRPDVVYGDIASIPKMDPSKGLWTYEPGQSNSGSYFTMAQSAPGYTIIARFSDTYIRDMVNKFQQNSNRYTMLYHPAFGFIGNPPSDLGDWERHLDWDGLQESGNRILNVNEYRVLLSYAPVESLDWVILDWVPLEKVVSPVKESSQFFVLGIIAMLAIGVVITALIYRQIQHPINELVQKLQDIRSGNLSSRLKAKHRDEFQDVFSGFNDMAERIQELIEKVYEEKLRLKEAELKQLQSQINPHFLYNCLFYIKNMAKMGEDEQVVAMALNLGEYFRYTTRLENPLTTIREEVKFLRNYLNIHSFRKPMRYEVCISEELMELSIPRLFIQPLVENAIIHGVERSDEAGEIRIQGAFIPGGFAISVEDSGDGLEPEALERLHEKMNLPLSPDTGCGLWNTHQRVINLYAAGSGLAFDHSSLGGLRVSIRCITKHQEEPYVKFADC